MIVDYSLIGRRLAYFRKKQKMTQEQLAEKTDLANNYISNIENSRSIPSLETLVKLCDALGVTPNDILLGASINSQQYLHDELQDKLALCTPKEKRLVEGFISLLLAEREMPKGTQE